MLAAALEEELGPADRPTGAGSWGEAVRADEAEAFPQGLVDAAGLLPHFVPAEQGDQI